MASAPDLTVAVTAHAETVVAGPSMHSADVAIREVERIGFAVERLIGLDGCSDACRDYFLSGAFADWRILELQERDLGLARNALTKASRGRAIAFLDADDLFSANWLKAGLKRLIVNAARGERAILHPELNWFFDSAQSLLHNIAQTDPLYTPFYWSAANYFDSLALAPREAFLETPYAARDKARGLGYEDWRWNLETMAAGWRHETVPDTVIFKRRQDMSLVVELDQNRALLWDLDLMAVDRLEALGL